MELSLLLGNTLSQYTILFVDQNNDPMVYIQSQSAEGKYGMVTNFKIISKNKLFLQENPEQTFGLIESAYQYFYEQFELNIEAYLQLRAIHPNNTKTLTTLQKIYHRNNEIKEGSLLFLTKLIELGYKPIHTKVHQYAEIKIKLKNQPSENHRFSFPHTYYDHDMSSFESHSTAYIAFKLSSQYSKKDYMKKDNVEKIILQVQSCEDFVLKNLTD